ncbi:class I SAM-dependent methyltransferase [Labrys okinawensis]|uniref:class I SAM-dependent methyltransferase n=1 Tax=Labrys okinawensis TaxID=346911 RepID=UPI0039BD0A20
MSEAPAREGEFQYGEPIAEIRRRGLERMGFMTSWAWLDDPRRLTFMLARYKFVAKMLSGTEKALEIGCGDGFGSRVVAQSVKNLTAIDFDPELLESARLVASEKFPVEFRRHDMMSGPVEGDYSACYSLDVLEHIQPSDENIFLQNLTRSLISTGVCIIGTPSLESQPYASKFSKLGHVNCKTQSALKETMLRFFNNVFMFSMNDEVVHTGYEKMSHYNLALCCGPKL